MKEEEAGTPGGIRRPARHHAGWRAGVEMRDSTCWRGLRVGGARRRRRTLNTHKHSVASDTQLLAQAPSFQAD